MPSKVIEQRQKPVFYLKISKAPAYVGIELLNWNQLIYENIGLVATIGCTENMGSKGHLALLHELNERTGFLFQKAKNYGWFILFKQ